MKNECYTCGEPIKGKWDSAIQLAIERNDRKAARRLNKMLKRLEAGQEGFFGRYFGTDGFFSTGRLFGTEGFFGGLIEGLSNSMDDNTKARLTMFNRRMDKAREDYVKEVMRATKPFDKELTGV